MNKPSKGPASEEISESIKSQEKIAESFRSPQADILRDYARLGAEQTKAAYEKMKAASDEFNNMLEDTWAAAAKGASEVSHKVMLLTDQNTREALGFAREVSGAMSPSEVMRAANTYATWQVNAVAAQTRELWELAQNIAVKTSAPALQRIPKIGA
jgi:hypothetical protein